MCNFNPNQLTPTLKSQAVLPINVASRITSESDDRKAETGARFRLTCRLNRDSCEHGPECSSSYIGR